MTVFASHARVSSCALQVQYSWHRFKSNLQLRRRFSRWRYCNEQPGA